MKLIAKVRHDNVNSEIVNPTTEGLVKIAEKLKIPVVIHIKKDKTC